MPLPAPFEMDHSVLDDGTHLIVVSGDIDTDTAPGITASIDKLRAAGGRYVIFDLAGVGFMDSSGLVAFMSAANRMRAAAGDMRIACPSPNVTHLFGLTRMDTVFAVFPTREAAMGGPAPG